MAPVLVLVPSLRTPQSPDALRRITPEAASVDPHCCACTSIHSSDFAFGSGGCVFVRPMLRACPLLTHRQRRYKDSQCAPGSDDLACIRLTATDTTSFTRHLRGSRMGEISTHLTRSIDHESVFDERMAMRMPQHAHGLFKVHAMCSKLAHPPAQAQTGQANAHLVHMQHWR